MRLDEVPLLKVLDWTDTVTICRYARTCKRAKRFVEANLKHLPRHKVEIWVHVSRREGYEGELLLFRASHDTVPNDMNGSIFFYVYTANLQDAVDQLKYADVEVVLNSEKVTIGVIQSLIKELEQCGFDRFTVDLPSMDATLMTSVDVPEILSLMRLDLARLDSSMDSNYVNLVFDAMLKTFTMEGVESASVNPFATLNASDIATVIAMLIKAVNDSGRPLHLKRDLCVSTSELFEGMGSVLEKLKNLVDAKDLRKPMEKLCAGGCIKVCLSGHDRDIHIRHISDYKRMYVEVFEADVIPIYFH